MVKQVRQVVRARPVREEDTGRLTAVGRAAVAGLRSLGGRTIAMIGTAVAVVLAVIVTGFFLYSHGTSRPPIPATRARHYTETDACLLTDRHGINAKPAATVWQGMQDASLTTHARVSYSSVTGEQSTANARPFLNALLQGSCEVVLAVGGPEVKAAQEATQRYAKLGFVLVGGGSGSGSKGGAGSDNVAWVPADDGLRAGVAAAVKRAVDARG
jgi:basic membrane lipoprotein Med (substrate-binding protein (PBP1-ABC) superfamily)